MIHKNNNQRVFLELLKYVLNNVLNERDTKFMHEFMHE